MRFSQGGVIKIKLITLLVQTTLCLIFEVRGSHGPAMAQDKQNILINSSIVSDCSLTASSSDDQFSGLIKNLTYIQYSTIITQKHVFNNNPELSKY